MQLRLDVAVATDPAWTAAVMNNFDTFLIDHAENERKANAMALSFVAKYPTRVEIIPGLLNHALEELEHFRDVYQFMHERNLQLPQKITEDSYAKTLMKMTRSGYNERFLDRLMLASVMEVRGGERFKLVEEALGEGPLKSFYKVLWITEAKHGDVFIKMALNYFSKEEIYDRLRFFNEEEGKIVEAMEIRPTIH